MQFLDNIKNPPKEFTPIPFWFFNDRPEEEKIRRQLADYVDKGVEGLVLHPRIGIPEEIPYLSAPYFEAVNCVVRTARQLGMKIVLYDEGMYPSGSAHGLVVAENADYASKGITLSDSPSGGQALTRLADGRYLVYGFTGGTIRGIHYGEDDGEAGAPKSADILNPSAVDAFIRLTHERYYQELREYFGSTIIAFFTDEPCPLGRNAGGFREWAAGMEAEILAQNGRLEELAALFDGGENPTTRLYHRLVKKHLRETYYARLSGWCEAHGIALMGHPEASDDVEEELYFHIPGQDLILRRVAPESGGIREFDSVQAKLPADIARYLGRRRNANECFGVCNHQGLPWYFKGYDMKWYINWLGIRGVNLFVPHAFYYSVAGARREERPPDVGPHNIWWPHYRLFSDYMKRISYLMTDAVSLARVAVLCDNNRVPAAEAAWLYERQIDFHYLPVAMLGDCARRENRLCIGGCEFDAVVDVYGYRQQDEYAAYLAGVRVVDEASAEDCRTVVTAGACPYLRAVHMEKEGVSWYLFSNEGEEPIETNVWIEELRADKAPLLISLWADCAQESCSLTASNDGRDGAWIGLRLAHCEMKLLLLSEEGAEPAAQAVRAVFDTVKNAFLGDWTARFAPVDSGDNTVTYRYAYTVSEGQALTGAECFTVRGEEMAECVCNGTFAGVSFYSPHTFRIGQYLRAGENEIRLRLTGNAVNVYGDARVPFGLARERAYEAEGGDRDVR
ncbi:MAG: hypothetical protein NC337_12975 [Roseburia sp.]|nr:hypothetical protein [Roseburia sp.]